MNAIDARRHYRVAALPGDGIGNEVLPAALRVLESLGKIHGMSFQWDHYDWGCDYYLRTGTMMPADALDQLSATDAVFLGAVGAPEVPDHVSLWGMLIPIRRGFDQYINLRPARLLPNVPSPLAPERAAGLDLVVVRENVEGEYSSIGGRLYSGTAAEMAVQESVFTRRGVTRVVDFACRLAESRRGNLASATKSNGIIHTMPFWDEVFAERTSEYPGLETAKYHIDALAALFVLDPARFDVVVASNLFGDILTDLAAAVTGSIGVAPSANINPGRDHPSMFEPVHGSAPDIAGHGVANPVGQFWSAVLMLEHLGEPTAAAALMSAIEAVLAEGVMTPDLAGTNSTQDVTDAVIDRIAA